MAKPSFSWTKSVWAALGAVLLFSGCLEGRSSLIFTGPEAGRLDLDWRWSEALDGIRVRRGNGPERLPWPQSQAEWQNLVQGTPGLTLSAYQRQVGEGEVRQTLSVSFTSTAGLSALGQALGQTLTVSPAGALVRLDWTSPVDWRLTPEETALVRRLWGARRLTLELRPPRAPAGQPEIPTLSRAVTGNEFISAPGPTWRVEW